MTDGPVLAQTASSGARTYRDNLPPCAILDTLGYDHQPDTAYPSVTTVISHGIPKKVLYLDGDRQPVDVLDKWGVREVAEFAVDHRAEWQDMDRDAAVKLVKNAPNRTRDRASKRGSKVHDIVEQLAAGHLVPAVSDDLEPWIRSARAFVAEFRPKVIWSETTVFNRQFGYAGTLDLIADFPGYGRMIADYKTSSDVYGSTGVQLAAYRHAEYGIHQDARQFLPDGIEGGLIVNLTADGYRVVPVECGKDQLDAFLCAIGVANHCVAADQLLGTPLRPVHLTGDDLQMVKAWLYQRVKTIVEHHPDAAQRLADDWPEGVPTIGKPDHTAYDLHRIEVVVDRVEAAYEIPFGESAPPSVGPQPTPEPATKSKRKRAAA